MKEPKHVQGQVIQPKRPDLVQELLDRFGQEVHDAIVDWIAKKMDKMKVEVEGLLASKNLALAEEPIGDRKMRVILYQKVDETTVEADVDVKVKE